MTPHAPTRSHRRTRAEQAEFYEHLVQTSLQLFADGGYEAISMRRLASEVGIPPMSLYRYFPTKAHLIRHIWDHILDRALQRALHDVDAGRSAPHRLRSFLAGFLDYWLEHRDHYWVVFATRDDIGPLHADVEALALGPNPHRIIDALDGLVGACFGRRVVAVTERQAALDLALCKVLGFLLGTIGLASLRWTDLRQLKERLLDDVLQQVVDTGRPAAGRAAVRLPR